MKRATIVLAIVAIAGCVPVPHSANLTPGVAGSMKSNGQPVSSLPLRLVVVELKDQPCAGRNVEFQTNANGEFYAPPIRTFSWVMIVMAHAYFPWAVCANTGSTWTVIHQDRTYMLADTGPAFLVNLNCSMATDWTCDAKEIWSPSQDLLRQLESRN